MKNINKYRFAFAAIAMIFYLGTLQAINTHGSMFGQGLSLYPIRDGATPGTPVAGTTFDYKIVTIGTQTWIWTDLHGKNIAGNSWSSQYRYWHPGKQENNLTGRISGTQQTYGTANLPNTNPVKITFLQEDNNVFFETEDLNYDYTKINSSNTADKEAPVLAEPVKGEQTALTLQLTLSATDNSNHFFYLITDAANNFTQVSFTNDVKLNLATGKSYNFSIYAIDFSGNESTAKIVSTEATETQYFVEGTAKDLNFKLDSRSLTELVVACISEKSIGDAFVKLTINGSAINKEWKPTIAATGTYEYQIHVPASEVSGWAKDGVLALNIGYIVMPIGNWGHYVVENSLITAGEFNGYPILHKIGTGVDITEPEPEPEMECENNILSDATISLGTPYFATGDSWVVSTNYTATYSNNELNIHFGDGSTLQWQAQFPLTLNAPVTPGETYGISANITTNNDIPIYAKAMDTDDNVFMEIPKVIQSASSTKIGAFKLVCPAGLTKITKILFDFGGNAANTDLKISNISICNKFKTVDAIHQAKTQGIWIYQQDKQLTVNSENKIKSIELRSLNGTLLLKEDNTQQISTEHLLPGLYILQAKDNIGQYQTFKVLIK